jgi:hypothetical protein
MWTPDHRRAADRGLRYPSDLTDDEFRLLFLGKMARV